MVVSRRIRRMAEMIHQLPFGNEALWAYLQDELENFKAEMREAVQRTMIGITEIECVLDEIESVEV